MSKKGHIIRHDLNDRHHVNASKALADHVSGEKPLSSRSHAVAFALAATALSSLLPLALPARAETASPGAETVASWPKSYDVGHEILQVYQPLIESWNGDQISGRAAIALGPKDGTPVYGTARFTARVAIDKPSRQAHLGPISIDRVIVPTDATQEQRLKSALQSRLPPEGITTALDQLQTSYAAAKELSAELNQPVSNAPPVIVFADRPTLLVPVSGDPVLKPVEGSDEFQRVMNTRALILVDRHGAAFLQAAGRWYRADSVNGRYAVLESVPSAVVDTAKLAERADAPDPMLTADGKRPSAAPSILIATVPTELIQTKGAAEMAPVPGTSLLTMANADHAVFVDPNSNQYYALISGRWFDSTDLKGPWAYVTPTNLPADFAKIPPQSAKGPVLVSVPGTPQAKEAAIAATIPQTATVSRKTRLDIAYDGEPRFEMIAGTPLAYAINTATPVIALDDGRYYAVSSGVWFVAGNPRGPWAVATVVPDVIYTIPVTSPIHYVTYVHVYATTADMVTVGYTPGYFGVAVNDGLVVYGTGYTCPGYVGTAWYGCPATYGYGADFALGTAAGFAFGFADGFAAGAPAPWWGPYGGVGPWGGSWSNVNVNATNIYGRWGGYATVNHAWGTNPSTGTEFAEGSAYGRTAGGTDFASRSAADYNPATNSGAAARQSASFNPYSGFGHASETSVTDQNGHLSADSQGVAGNVKTGNGVAWNNGHIYTDHDGTVHQYNDHHWQQQSASGWRDDTDQDLMKNLDTQRNYQKMADDRVDSFAARGGFDGGDRFGGGGFDDGDRFGRFGGGGFDDGDRFGGFGGGRFGGFRR